MDPIRDCFEEGLAMTGNEEPKKYTEINFVNILKFLRENPGCLGMVIVIPLILLILILVLKFA